MGQCCSGVTMRTYTIISQVILMLLMHIDIITSHDKCTVVAKTFSFLEKLGYQENIKEQTKRKKIGKLVKRLLWELNLSFIFREQERQSCYILHPVFNREPGTHFQAQPSLNSATASETRRDLLSQFFKPHSLTLHFNIVSIIAYVRLFFFLINAKFNHGSVRLFLCLIVNCHHIKTAFPDSLLWSCLLPPV